MCVCMWVVYVYNTICVRMFVHTLTFVRTCMYIYIYLYIYIKPLSLRFKHITMFGGMRNILSYRHFTTMGRHICLTKRTS